MVKRKQKSTANQAATLDVDARFLLANERTFLAWVRTALAVLIGGIALTQLGHDSSAQDGIGMAVVVLGGFMALVGYLRFHAADRAIRRGDLPEVGREPFIQASGIVFVALVLVVTHLLNIW
jgi:putative membrane protein